jgi:hypothetical protein
MTPVAPNQFTIGSADRHYRFEEGTRIRMRVTSPDDDVLYERVEPVHPAAADLTALLGKYDSRETGATLTIAASKKPDELTLQVATNAPIPLKPTFRDAFLTPSGSSIFFVRDAAGKVVALSAGEDRVWDLRFTRVAHAF